MYIYVGASFKEHIARARNLALSRLKQIYPFLIVFDCGESQTVHCLNQERINSLLTKYFMISSTLSSMLSLSACKCTSGFSGASYGAEIPVNSGI
jgi:hypothetical protein